MLTSWTHSGLMTFCRHAPGCCSERVEQLGGALDLAPCGMGRHRVVCTDVFHCPGCGQVLEVRGTRLVASYALAASYPRKRAR